MQLEWASPTAPDNLLRQQAAQKVQNDRAEADTTAGPRALPESGENEDGKSSSSGPSGEGSGTSPGNARDRPGSTSSNVVPKESVARAAISIAAAGAMSSDERNSLQQGQWVTASFDDLPDR